MERAARAIAARGRAIARLVDRRGGAACDWTSVVDGDGRLLDLTDPLVRRTRWTRATREASGDSGLPDGIRLRRVLKAHGDRVTWVAWARDGRLLSLRSTVGRRRTRNLAPTGERKTP